MMIRVSLDEIKTVFDDLIYERKTREEVSEWACERQEACDDGQLQFIPSKEEDRIWEAITFLMSVDLFGVDRPYLYGTEDFIIYRKELDEELPPPEIFAISIEELKAMFDAYIRKKKTGKEVSEWAIKRSNAYVRGNARYDPDEKEDIWMALNYLETAWQLDAPNPSRYMYQEFLMFRLELALGTIKRWYNKIKRIVFGDA